MYKLGLVKTFTEKPKQDNLTVAKRILRYVKGKIDHNLFYILSQNSKLVDYSDSDYGGDLDDLKSTSRFLFYIDSATFSWSSKKKQTIALSTFEAEYVDVVACTCKVIWLNNILDELSLTQEDSITIYIDNEFTLSLWI